VPGSATSSRPLYETRSFVAPADDAMPEDTSKQVRRLVRHPASTPGPASFDPNALAAMPSESSPPGLSTSFHDRSGNWTSFSGVGAPIAPDLPVAPSPQAGRPLGLLTGKPMPDHPFPPPILGLPDKLSSSGNEDWALGLLRPPQWRKKTR
jgi:hypothetical protein